MDVTQQGILLLLKSAITEEPQALPEGFDIESAYPLIQKHHMITLCYDGAVRCGVSRQHPVMRQLFAGYCKALAISEGQMRQINRVFRAFDENGIDYMPLKGCNMKAIYPKPELRIMGDADILVRVEQYEQIKPLMTLLGFSPVLESDHELTWKSPGLYLELHKRLIPTPNKDFYAYYGDGWHLARHKTGGCCSMMAEDEFIYLFTHFSKHYRAGGIGCRHVLDLWVYLRTKPEMDEAYICAQLEHLHLLEFFKNIRRLMAMWFEGTTGDEKLEYMSEYVFSSGSFGRMEEWMRSMAIRRSKCLKYKPNEKLMYMCTHLFPRIGQIRNQYPFLEKWPLLLPVIWIVRPVQKILFDRHSIVRTFQDMKLMDREQIDKKHQMLRYVGLDYNF